MKNLQSGHNGVTYSRTRRQQERRLRHRLDLHVSGIVRSSHGQSRSCRVMNLSDDGLYFRYAGTGCSRGHEYLCGEPVEILMAHHPLDDEAGLRLKSKVVRTDSQGVGVRFLHPEPEAAFKLSGYLSADRASVARAKKKPTPPALPISWSEKHIKLAFTLAGVLLMGLGSWLAISSLDLSRPVVEVSGQPNLESERFAQVVEPLPEAAVVPESKQWIINIITFRSETEADTFLQNTRNRGVNAYKEITRVNGESLWRIRVGGLKTHTQARLRAIRIRALLGIEELWITNE